jgi:hypothetical protein
MTNPGGRRHGDRLSPITECVPSRELVLVDLCAFAFFTFIFRFCETRA